MTSLVFQFLLPAAVPTAGDPSPAMWLSALADGDHAAAACRGAVARRRRRAQRWHTPT
ncbi:MAG: hypothetical protein U1F49_02855 [Rubrivivax sp.]